eukprot:Partr_v1_DN26084_c0_g1_i2_m558 putative tryptophanyltRNA synthetase
MLVCVLCLTYRQDPYFRMTRDVARRLKYPKPALVHAKFFPALQGPGSKMSASIDSSAIFMSDTPNQIKKKINRFGFSGGQDTKELQELHGGNPDVDVAYQYLTFFLDDDAELAELNSLYRAGKLMSSEMKARCVEVLQDFVESFQKRKAAVTDDDVKAYMDASKSMPYIEKFPAPPVKSAGKKASKKVKPTANEQGNQ